MSIPPINGNLLQAGGHCYLVPLSAVQDGLSLQDLVSDIEASLANKS